MRSLIQPLLMLLVRATDAELVRMVEYLKEENRILRSKLPKRIAVTEAEKGRLVKLGRKLGPALKEVIGIVSPRTFLRWANREATEKQQPRKRGRPRKPEEVRQMIVAIAKETGWGYKRILGELKKLGIRNVSRATVQRFLKENGYEPGPKRGKGTWDEFVKRHLQTLWACDFLTKKVWTPGGLVEYYILFFIHVKTRRVHVAGVTPNPDAAWMAQQARNLAMHFEEQGECRPTHIVRDRDRKFTEEFCSILESEGVEFREIPPRSPDMDPFSERWVQSLKQECLDHFLVFGEKHLRHLINEYLDCYHCLRPHQGLKNELVIPRPGAVVMEGAIVRHERLGGLLKHYERKAP